MYAGSKSGRATEDFKQKPLFERPGDLKGRFHSLTMVHPNKMRSSFGGTHDMRTEDGMILVRHNKLDGTVQLWLHMRRSHVMRRCGADIMSRLSGRLFTSCDSLPPFSYLLKLLVDFHLPCRWISWSDMRPDASA